MITALHKFRPTDRRASRQRDKEEWQELASNKNLNEKKTPKIDRTEPCRLWQSLSFGLFDEHID